ncbi:MAG: carbohydrate kinase [Cytophagaceae bacterium SCN 52-12]|nr:MAG: carbohydrate kinase [Cytophagaceae bacterium SCN 52-12]
MSLACFLGVDVGTQGVRVVLTDELGKILGSEEIKTFRRSPQAASYRVSQNPDEWWEAAQECLGRLLSAQPSRLKDSIQAISVTSTSGTVIPLDKDNRPLSDAIMYSDTRQEAEGKLCRELALQHHPSGYTGFNASSGLPKMVWFVKNYPEQAAFIKTWIHAADYLTGKLCGNFRTTDHTNALKSGYDLTADAWPEYLTRYLPLQESWLQEVVPPGTFLGPVIAELQARWGLPAVQVVAGMTDGCASQVASGAVSPGDWNTTIGTTLVVKGVTKQQILDPQGRLYCHRHPQGYWMPGGASNTGADWISEDFGDELEAMNRVAATLIPTGFSVYPLRQKGERFPFIDLAAQGFTDPAITRREQLFAAGLEGVAYIEKLSYELVETLSGEEVTAVYSSGGGANSTVWMKIRANVLGRPVYKMSHTSGALGAAVVAASQVYFSNLTEAAGAMTHPEKCFEPEASLTEAYETYYANFRIEMKRRGYLEDSANRNPERVT